MKSFLTFVLVALVSAAAILFFRQRWKSETLQFTSTDQFIKYMAAEAVADAKQQDHVNLDYSVGSIKRVDEILGRVHDQYVQDPSSISAKGLGYAYGAYIGEVIRRSEPGARWERDDPVAGEKTYPIIWKAGHSYPMAWCYHRIVNGREDNVWVKYLALKAETVNAQ